MKTIKILVTTVIAACTFAVAEAQIKLPPPPPAPPNPLHLNKPPLPKAHSRRTVRRGVVVKHKRHVTVRRPAL